jgi:hypothetical protein
MTFDDDDYYAKADHEAASKFIGQKLFREFQNHSRRPRSTSFAASWLAGGEEFSFTTPPATFRHLPAFLT